MGGDAILIEAFLGHLGLQRQAPDLAYLNVLVDRHQRRVPFETLTKLIDYERGHESGEFLPDIETYVNRIVTSGTGGTCWTLARGFHWLLSQLGFDAKYMIMEPGHVCLRVELDQAYYADVGYAAPLFRAYPLNESFTVEDVRCSFHYEVTDDGIVTRQTPGPVKRLITTPRDFKEFDPLIKDANQWTPDSFLTRLSIFSYLQGVPTGLINGTLKRHLPEGLDECSLSHEETLSWFVEKFGVDPDIYCQAGLIHSRWMRHHGL